MIKIGHSKDVHQLVNNRDLIIGGVTIDYEKGLLGHSDADVLLHAITESIIGALGLGDIGTLYPDTASEFLGCDSTILLKDTYNRMIEAGYRIGNLDATIFAEAPKMGLHIPKMKKVISSILNTSEDLINIKATRGEKMGFIGRGEGIAAECVVLIYND